MMCEGTTVTSCSSSVMQSESEVGLLDRSWLLRPLEKTLSPLPHGVWLLSTNWRSCAVTEGEEHVWRRGGGGDECRNRSATVRSSSLCPPHTPLQLLLSYSDTDSNLQGDLGNTPTILACSINNCDALTMLVRHKSASRVHPKSAVYLLKITVQLHRADYQLISTLFLTKHRLCLSFSPLISFRRKAESWSEALQTEQAWPFPNSRRRLRGC